MTLPNPLPRSLRSFRLLLAGTRLICAYAFLCYLVVQGSLYWRSANETAMLPAQISAKPVAAPPGLLGVTVAMERMGRDERQAALHRLQKHGVSWVRQRIDWGTVEMEPGAFDWRWLDAWLTDVEAAGLAPVIVLDGSPAWARSPQDRAPTDNPHAPPADFADFVRFAGAFARRYADRIRYYQVWDEPNIAPHWGNRHIEPVHYAQLLAAASAAIRAADADAVILTAALAPTADRGHLAVDEVYFWQRMRAAGATASFDAVAIQPFGFGFAATNPRQSLSVLSYQRTKFLRRALMEMGWADKAVWAVRFGWNVRSDSPWGTVTSANQRAYTADAVAIAREDWPWLAALGWAIDQPNASPDDPMWGFALHDDLLAAFSTAGVQNAANGKTPLNPLPFLGVFVSLIALVIWRMVAAASLLPWSEWRRGMQEFSTAKMLLAWSALLVVYYLATWPPLIVLCWLCAGFFTLCRPHWGLWVALLALPFTFQHKEVRLVDLTLTVSPMMAAALILTPLLVTQLAGQRREWLRPIVPRNSRAIRATGALSLLLIAWLPINLLSAYNVWHWASYWRGMAELVVAPLVIAGAVILLTRDGLSQRSVVITLFAGGAIMAAIGLARWVAGQGVEVDGVLRLTATQFSPNHTALYLTRTLFLGIGLLLAARGAERMGWGALTLLVGGALLLTASRGALLLGAPIGGALVVGVWLWQRRAGGRAASRHLLVAMIGLGAVIFVGLAVMEAQTRLLNTETIQARALLWQAAWRLWQEFPFVGVGAGGFHWAYPAHVEAGNPLEVNLLHPHNVWLEVATGWGAVGALWFVGLLTITCWLFTRAARRSLGDQRWLLVGLAAALTAGLAHAQVDAFLALSDLAGWFFVALGLLRGVRKEG